MADLSDEAIEQATGRSRQDWHRILDRYGLELDHTQRARRLAEDHPDLPGWWCQGLVVDFERARGLRQPGQSHAGDFQVSCSRTLQVGPEEAWQRLISTPFLTKAQWDEGARWSTDGAEVEVRRVDPGKMLRWFWNDEHGRSIVEVAFEAKPGRTAIVFAHRGLPSKAAAEAQRARWRGALDDIAGTAKA